MYLSYTFPLLSASSWDIIYISTIYNNTSTDNFYVIMEVTITRAQIMLSWKLQWIISMQYSYLSTVFTDEVIFLGSIFYKDAPASNI